MSCHISSLAIINSLGSSISEISENLFSAEKLFLEESEEYLISENCFVGKIREELPVLPKTYDIFDSRYIRILFFLYLQLESEIKNLIKEFGSHRIGIVIGTSNSGVDETERAFLEKGNSLKLPNWFKYYHQEIGSGSDFLAKISKISGPAYTISTACTSSAKAFISGDMLIQAGVCDAVIVGGVDALCALTVRGFKSLDLISHKPCNPMSKNRDGLNIGEGGALFILTKEKLNSEKKGIRLLGYGESSDAYHISSPHPEGLGAINCINQTLEKTKRNKERVKYVNLHGTATVFNDAMESTAISKTLGLGVKCSSTKGLTGHLLGASGACEAAFCYLTLMQTEQFLLPPHVFDGEQDQSIPKLNLVKKQEKINFLADDLILSTSFAFGGSNCCLAFGYQD